MAVIADDFTGANDTGVQFSKKGRASGVLFRLESLEEALSSLDVVVIDTESRFDDPPVAREKVAEAIRRVVGRNAVWIYKKIDSTMRGNIGAEIDGALAASGAPFAILAAAMPSNRRVTRGGQCIVDGTPVGESGFARDPRTPVRASSIGEIIGFQTSRPLTAIGLEVVRSGGKALAEAFVQAGGAADILIVDAESEDDLRAVGEAIRLFHSTFERTGHALPLLVGSAGLAEWLPRMLFPGGDGADGASGADHRAGPGDHATGGGHASGAGDRTSGAGDHAGAGGRAPILFAIGSVSATSREQLDRLLEARYDALGLTIDPVRVLESGAGSQGSELDRIERRLGDALASGRVCVLRTTEHAGDTERTIACARRLGLGEQEASERLARFLGALVCRLVHLTPIRGLVLSGGDTAIKSAEALGVSGFHIDEEVLPGVPCGRFIGQRGGSQDPDGARLAAFPVVTKAGGFGGENAMIEILNYLERT